MLLVDFNGHRYRLKRGDLNVTARTKGQVIKEMLAGYFHVDVTLFDPYVVEWGQRGELRVYRGGSCPTNA